MALALTESGLMSHEQLYACVRQEDTEILRELLTWSEGEVSFAEGVKPPGDRLPLTLSITSLLPSLSDPISPSSVSTSNLRSVREEPSLPVTPPSIPTTPHPFLFKKSKPGPIEEEPSTPAMQFPTIPTMLEASRPALQERLGPATPVSTFNNIGTPFQRGIVLSSVTSSIHPSPNALTLKHPTPGMRFKKHLTVHASKKRYRVFTGVLLLFVFFLPGALAWAPMQGALSAPSLPALNAAIARAEQYISQLYKPIDGSTATVAEYYGVPLRVYMTRYHSWILLGENSSTSAITNVENRQASETFVAEFHSSQFFRSPRIRVDVNWNEDPAHYQIRFTNEQFDDQRTSALVYLYDLYIGTYSSTNVGRSASLTFAKTDITHLHSFRYTIRHGNQLAQNYFWYKQDRDKYERLARFLAQQGYQLDYDIYAPIWGYGEAYPDDLPYHISNSDGNEVYHDCHASSWNDTLNYVYQSKVCKVGVGIYLEVSRRDLLTISIQAQHILNKYGDPKRSYVDGGNQQSTPLSAAAQLEQKFDQSDDIGIPMCSPIGCNYGLASGVRTFNFGALETMLGYGYGYQQSRTYADTVAGLALEIQVGDDDTLRMADGSTFYRPAQRGAFYLSWGASMEFGLSKPFGYEYINALLNMPDEYRGVLVSDMETTFNAYAFLVLYRCKKYGVGCAAGTEKPHVTGLR